MQNQPFPVGFLRTSQTLAEASEKKNVCWMCLGSLGRLIAFGVGGGFCRVRQKVFRSCRSVRPAARRRAFGTRWVGGRDFPYIGGSGKRTHGLSRSTARRRPYRKIRGLKERQHKRARGYWGPVDCQRIADRSFSRPTNTFIDKGASEKPTECCESIASIAWTETRQPHGTQKPKSYATPPPERVQRETFGRRSVALCWLGVMGVRQVLGAGC